MPAIILYKKASTCNNPADYMRPLKSLLLLALGCLILAPLMAPTLARSETLLEKLESPYNTIFVYEQTPYITLAFGHKHRRYVESRRNPDDLTELPVPYTRAFTIALAYPQTLDSILMIGMGGGSTSWYVHEALPKAKVIAVELDEEIIRLAKKYYKLEETPRFSIRALDGRVHILRDKTKHDIIFIDAYRGPFVPFHLMTKEFFTLAKKRLKPGGVLAQNIEPSTMLFDRAIATMVEVFDQVDLYEADGNMVAIAYDGPKRNRQEVLAAAKARQAEHLFRYDLGELVKARSMMLDYDTTQPPLTDDFAPVNMLKEIESHNKKLPDNKPGSFFFNE